MGLCYTTSRWADRLWSSHVKHSPIAQRIVKDGQARQSDYDGFAQDLHSRLYLNNEPNKLEGGPGWAESLHSAASDLAEWKQLKSRCRHDGFLAGLATESILQSLASQIPQQSEPGTPGTEPLPYTSEPGVPGAGSGQPVAWTDKGQSDPSETRRRLRRAIRDARDKVVEVEGSLDGLQAPLGLRRPGTHVGEQVTYRDLDKVREAHSVVSKSRNLKRIAELAGRLARQAASKKRAKVSGSVGAVKGVELSGDLSRVLPSELAGLRGSRYERLLTLAKLVERRALSYRLEARNTEIRGPVIVCQDLSSSMRDDSRDLYAKACALAILGTATEQKRDWTMVGFSTRVRHVDTVLAGTADAGTIERILSHAPSGGTDFTPPLRKAIHIIETAESMSKADIVIITDGEAYLDEDVRDKLQELTKNNGLNIYVIAIGTEAEGIKQGPLGEIATKLATITQTSLMSSDPVVSDAINL